MKMTFDQKKKTRAKVHGFRSRMSTAKVEEKYLLQEEQRKKEIISVGRIYVALFFYSEKLGE